MAREAARQAAGQAARGQAIPQVVVQLCELIEATELLRDAVRAREARKASQATALLTPAFIATFSHDDDIVREGLNFLARVRRLVRSDSFHEAEALILGWLIRLHQTAATLASALRR